AVSFKAQVDNLNRERGRLRMRTEQAAEHLASLDLELQELTAADEALQARLTDAKQALAELKQERERFLTLRDETAQRGNDLRDASLLAQALKDRPPFSGRVSFLPLHPPAAPEAQPRRRRSDAAPLSKAAPDGDNTPTHPGVVALASQLVRCDDPEMIDLPAR